MKHIILTIVIAVVGFAMACDNGQDVSPDLATVNTGEITEIGVLTASLSSTVEFDGGAEVTARGVCWSTLSDPIITDNSTIDGAGEGRFSSTLTELEPNTFYYVRAYATNSKGTSYGESETFTTLDGMPDVITYSVTEITDNSAMSGGEVIDDGGLDISARGICWNTTGDPSIDNNKTVDGAGEGAFSSEMLELLPNTVYYVRAYASNEVATSYGETLTFRTLNEPVEFITTLVYHLEPEGSGETIEFRFTDLDGAGGDPPVIESPVIKSNTVYDGSITLLNELEVPPLDITEQIEAEGTQFQFFYVTDALLNIYYVDEDLNGNPIGLRTSLGSANASTGTLTIILRYKPLKPNDGTPEDAGGETEIEVVFNVIIQ